MVLLLSPTNSRSIIKHQVPFSLYFPAEKESSLKETHSHTLNFRCRQGGRLLRKKCFWRSTGGGRKGKKRKDSREKSICKVLLVYYIKYGSYTKSYKSQLQDQKRIIIARQNRAGIRRERRSTHISTNQKPLFRLFFYSV